MKTVDLTLNGKKTSIEVEDNETLLYALRERLGITSVKEGCGIGESSTAVPDIRGGDLQTGCRYGHERARG